MNLNPFIDLISTILTLYNWVLIVWIILSWLTAFNIVNRYQPFVQKLSYALHQLTEPILSRIRRFMPDLGAIDLAPIVLFLLLHFIQRVLYTYFYV